MTVAGSRLVRPVVRIAAKIYGKQSGLRIKVLGGGTKRGIEEVASGDIDLGMASRDLRGEERARFPDLRLHTIGYDGLTLIVNRDNPVEAVSSEQVRQVYTGGIRNWKDLGGPDLPIRLMASEPGRSAHEDFLVFFGLVSETSRDGVHFRRAGMPDPGSPAAERIGPDRMAVVRVGKNVDAIAYVSFAVAEHAEKTLKTVKRLVLDGVPATREALRDGSYPIIRPLNLVSFGGGAGHAKGLTEYLLSDHGQNIVKNMGFIPVH